MPKVQGPMPKVQCPMSKVQGPMSKGLRSKVQCPSSKVKHPRSKDKGPRTKVLGQRSKDKGPRTKVQGQRSKVGASTPYLGSVPLLHDPRPFPQTTTFWDLKLGLLGIRVTLTGRLGFYGRSMVLEKWDTTHTYCLHWFYAYFHKLFFTWSIN